MTLISIELGPTWEMSLPSMSPGVPVFGMRMVLTITLVLKYVCLILQVPDVIARTRFRQTVLTRCSWVTPPLSSSILVRTFRVTVVVPRFVMLVLTIMIPVVHIFEILFTRMLWFLPVCTRVPVLIRGVRWLVILDTGVRSGRD